MHDQLLAAGVPQDVIDHAQAKGVGLFGLLQIIQTVAQWAPTVAEAVQAVANFLSHLPTPSK